jgi:hypothetical protein
VNQDGLTTTELKRDAVQNGGLPPWLQANSETGEIEGTIVSIRMHIEDQE